MSMFQYFPNNHVWNLSVDSALESRAQIGEIDEMCRPLLGAASRGADIGTGEFLNEWLRMGNKLVELADEDRVPGRHISASKKLQRAPLYFIIAERMQGHGHAGWRETFEEGQKSFRDAMRPGQENCERFEIAYAGSFFPVLLTRAASVPAPAVLFVNGLDSCKELLYWIRLPLELKRRGVPTLCIDQPGTGEALRANGLHASYDSEAWASPVFGWLAARADIDADRTGMAGISLAGHFVPRAIAKDRRFACGAVRGANHNRAEVQQERLKNEGENPVPHYWKHVMWVFGATDMDDFMAKIEGMNLNGIMDKIRVPFLVTHGERDRQISVDYARQSYEQLIDSPDRELRIFTRREGGVEHVGVDNMSFGRDYIADWLAGRLGGHTHAGFVEEQR